MLDHSSLSLKFSYGSEMKSISLQVVRRQQAEPGSRGATSSEKLTTIIRSESFKPPPRRVGTARKGLKRSYPTGKTSISPADENGENRIQYERAKQLGLAGSVAALAFHPTEPSTLLIGTFEGQYQLIELNSGKEYATGTVGVKRNSTAGDHTITKIKWDPSGTCACLSGATPTIYVITWKRTSFPTTFKVNNVHEIGANAGRLLNSGAVRAYAHTCRRRRL